VSRKATRARLISANRRAAGLPASLPAASACTVTRRYTTTAVRWTARQVRLGSRRINSEVAWTATSRYRPSTPQATATGCQAEASGTSSSAGPKCT
jgi:hypothetical protein